MSEIPIQIENINKSFGAKLVLDDISFAVKNNEIFGFVGLNGVGKTTLIKIIIDLLNQDNGEVKIFGKSKFSPGSRQNIFYLPEKFYPSMQLKGKEFLQFVCGLHKKNLDLKKACEIAQILDLEADALNIKIAKYSKGMVQKLGLLGTFLSEAQLIILDEPMSGLDPKARIALKRLLIDYKNSGKSIFFSSHILSDIDEICDYLAVLDKAKIKFLGRPTEFKARHKEDNLEKAFLAEIGV